MESFLQFLSDIWTGYLKDPAAWATALFSALLILVTVLFEIPKIRRTIKFSSFRFERTNRGEDSWLEVNFYNKSRREIKGIAFTELFSYSGSNWELYGGCDLSEGDKGYVNAFLKGKVVPREDVLKVTLRDSINKTYRYYPNGRIKYFIKRFLS